MTRSLLNREVIIKGSTYIFGCPMNDLMNCFVLLLLLLIMKTLITVTCQIKTSPCPLRTAPWEMWKIVHAAFRRKTFNRSLAQFPVFCASVHNSHTDNSKKNYRSLFPHKCAHSFNDLKFECRQMSGCSFVLAIVINDAIKGKVRLG